MRQRLNSIYHSLWCDPWIVLPETHPRSLEMGYNKRYVARMVVRDQKENVGGICGYDNPLGREDLAGKPNIGEDVDK